MSKTIQIFLKDSDIHGTKIAGLSNGVARVYVVPRTDMAYVQSRADLARPSLYMLFDDERTSVYIGETENFQNRVVGHMLEKDFWSVAVICVSVAEGMDKADVKFLESHSISKAIESARCEVHNKTNPAKNNLGEFKRAEVLSLFEDFELLLTTLGFTLFEQRITDAVLDPTPKLRLKKKGDSDSVRDFDTFVGPCKDDGFETAFVKESAWWAVRIGEVNIPKLRYVALYEVAPVSAIRAYAKITTIEPYPEAPGKYIIHHDGDIHYLKHPIVMGENPELSLYGPRYYKLADMLSSKTLLELTERTFGAN